VPNRFDSIPNRRAIIDRRPLADALAALEGARPTFGSRRQRS
jgi:hypothetical protein